MSLPPLPPGATLPPRQSHPQKIPSAPTVKSDTIQASRKPTPHKQAHTFNELKPPPIPQNSTLNTKEFTNAVMNSKIIVGRVYAVMGIACAIGMGIGIYSKQKKQQGNV